jgi:hypothetical protein
VCETETEEELIRSKWMSRPTMFYTVLYTLLRYNKIQVGNFIPFFSFFSCVIRIDGLISFNQLKFSYF